MRLLTSRRYQKVESCNFTRKFWYVQVAFEVGTAFTYIGLETAMRRRIRALYGVFYTICLNQKIVIGVDRGWWMFSKATKTQKSAGKIMVSTLWNANEILITDYLEKNKTINSENSATYKRNMCYFTRTIPRVTSQSKQLLNPHRELQIWPS